MLWERFNIPDVTLGLKSRLGKEPVRLLSETSRKINLGSESKLLDKLPESKLFPSDNLCKLFNLVSSNGSSPENVLELRSRTVKVVMLENCVGIGDERLLPERFRKERFGRLPKASGMIPDK